VYWQICPKVVQVPSRAGSRDTAVACAYIRTVPFTVVECQMSSRPCGFYFRVCIRSQEPQWGLRSIRRYSCRGANWPKSSSGPAPPPFSHPFTAFKSA
jgi:hypothetical protein